MRAFGLALTVLLLLSAASCGRHGQVSAPNELRFWNGFTGPDGATMERIVKQFERETGIRVKHQIIPWNTYYDKLTLSLAYGGAPDVFICHANRIAEFGQHGALRPLDDLIQADPGFPFEDVLPNVRQAASFGGKQVAFPLDCHPLGLFYNTELFEEEGIVDAAGRARPPATLEEFLDAARRLTKDLDGDGKTDQWGLNYTWWRTNWIAFISQHGGSILTPDLKRAALNQPSALAGTNQMLELINRHRIAPNPEGIDAWLGFRQGRVAMALEGIYMLSSVEEQSTVKYAGAPIPQFGPRRATWGGSHTMCMPRDIDAPHRDMAWRFMKYLSDHSLEWARGGQVPVRHKLLADPRFKTMQVQYAFSKQLPYVVFEPASHKASEVMPFYDAAIESALLGIQTPQEAMDEAARRIDQVLSRP